MEQHPDDPEARPAPRRPTLPVDVPLTQPGPGGGATPPAARRRTTLVDSDALAGSAPAPARPDAETVLIAPSAGGGRDAPTHVDGGPRAPTYVEEDEEGPGAASTSAEAPSSVGPYQVLGELGRGGIAVVYRARHPELEREVAVKVLLAGHHASEHQRERFLLEARAAARLRHPNLVTIHDVGYDDAGTEVPYLVMELVEGTPLDRYLALRGPLEQREAARLVRDLALALAYAHGQGVMHRDVKPANVLLDPEGRPHLTDFGLAKHLDSESKGPTVTGQVLGTPHYMSPEQAKAGFVDATTDVYALGVTLYELLTGKVPFDGEGILEVLGKILRDDVEPPSRDVPGLDKDLETICLACLEKEPRRRYASAQLLANDLDRYLGGEAIVARPRSLLRREWDAVRANRAASPVLFVLVLVTGVVLAWRVMGLNEDGRYRLALAELDARTGETRVNAALDLARHGEPAVPHLLEAARLDPLPGVRMAALKSLGELLPDPDVSLRWSVPQLLMCLEEPDRSPGEERAVRALLVRLAGTVPGEAPPLEAPHAEWRTWWVAAADELPFGS